MHAAMKRDIDKTRSKRDNLVLAAGLVILIAFFVVSFHTDLSEKWNTVAFGTLVPFGVAVQTYPRRWRRWSFWVALAMCLMVHLGAMWVVFRYVFVNRAPRWLLWLPVAFVEAFVLIVAVKLVEDRLLGKHAHSISL
jgi:hypothetical protein